MIFSINIGDSFKDWILYSFQNAFQCVGRQIRWFIKKEKLYNKKIYSKKECQLKHQIITSE